MSEAEIKLCRVTVESLQPFCQRPAARGQGVDALGHLRVFDQRRRVVEFDAGVDHQRTAAAPMFLVSKRRHAIHIGCRIAAREGDPQEVRQSSAGKFTVVHVEPPFTVLEIPLPRIEA